MAPRPAGDVGRVHSRGEPGADTRASGVAVATIARTAALSAGGRVGQASITEASWGSFPQTDAGMGAGIDGFAR